MEPGRARERAGSLLFFPLLFSKKKKKKKKTGQTKKKKNRGAKRLSNSFYRDGDFFSLPALSRASASAAVGRRQRHSSRVFTRRRVRGPCRRAAPSILREVLNNILALHTVRFYTRNDAYKIRERKRKVLSTAEKLTVCSPSSPLEPGDSPPLTRPPSPLSPDFGMESSLLFPCFHVKLSCCFSFWEGKGRVLL